LLGTGKRTSLAYHPESGGPTEVLYRCSGFTSGVLRQDNQQAGQCGLIRLDYGITPLSNFHVSVGMTSFEVVSMQITTITCYLQRETRVEAAA